MNEQMNEKHIASPISTCFVPTVVFRERW